MKKTLPLTNHEGEVRELTPEDLSMFKSAKEALPRGCIEDYPFQRETVLREVGIWSSHLVSAFGTMYQIEFLHHKSFFNQTHLIHNL